MSKLWARFAGLFSSKNFVGIDKVGNRYFKNIEELDGVSKWVFVSSLSINTNLIFVV